MKQHHRHANKQTSVKTLSILILDTQDSVEQESWDNAWGDLLLRSLTVSDDVTMDAIDDFLK